MNARIAQLETLLARVQERQKAARGDAPPATEPLALDSPSEIPPSMEPDSLDMPGFDAPTVEISADSVEVTEVELDDEIPESGPVTTPKGEEFGVDSEAPITPPPESVEEVVAPSARGHAAEPNLAQPGLVGPTAFMPASAQPTMEQVGQTVELEEGDPASGLELDEPGLEEPADSITISSSSAFAVTAAGTVAEHEVIERRMSTQAAVEIEGAPKRTSARSFFDLVEASLRLK